MEPASTIIKALGGPTQVARVVGIHRTRVSMWQVPRERGGTGGLIPYRHVPKILAFAEQKGVTIDRASFVPSPGDAA